MEGLTSTIINLQQKLKVADEKISKLEKELKEKETESNGVNEEVGEGEHEPPAKKVCTEES